MQHLFAAWDASWNPQSASHTTPCWCLYLWCTSYLQGANDRRFAFCRMVRAEIALRHGNHRGVALVDGHPCQMRMMDRRTARGLLFFAADSNGPPACLDDRGSISKRLPALSLSMPRAVALRARPRAKAKRSCLQCEKPARVGHPATWPCLDRHACPAVKQPKCPMDISSES